MLRDFQDTVANGVYTAWTEPGVHVVMPVLPTGGGKTILCCAISEACGVPTAAVAHRQELVSQMALSFNRARIPHDIIAPKQVKHDIIRLEHDTHGHSAYQYRADTRIAGVDTLPNHDAKDRWLSHVGLVIQDEGHHVLASNKWGKAMALFPNARGLFPTAHATRADGAGLGRTARGLVDRLVIGPSCRELINRGYLTDYRLLCPPNDIDFSDVPISPTTGDYVQPKLRAATHGSNRIVGDVVKHYIGYAAGKLGITFAVDIEEAKRLATGYRAAGIPAEVITGKTPIGVRGQLMRQFRERRILQLVSVDCLGEGVDVPAVEVVSLVRKTASWQLYCQQIGRALRPMLTEDEAAGWGAFNDAERLAAIAMSSKPKAIIIDHVGNCMYHGLPDVPQEYTLLNRDGGARKRLGPSSVRTCSECLQPYERFLLSCPHCGEPYLIMERGSPEAVEGDLIELDPAVLAKIRGEVAKIDQPVYFPVAAGRDARINIFRSHTERAHARKQLAHTISVWGGWRAHVLEPERQAQKRFFLTFGVDVLTAQTLSAEQMKGLEVRIRENLSRNNIVEATA